MIYDNKHRDLAVLAQDDDKFLGQLLDYVCPGENQDQLNDRMSQTLYANESPFITQMCSIESYGSKQDEFNEQLKKYQDIGKILNVKVTMGFRKVTGSLTLISEIHENGTQGIIKYKDELINIMRQCSEDDYKKTIDLLDQG